MLIGLDSVLSIKKKKKKNTNPKTWLLKGPKCLFIMISNTEQGTAESLLLFTLKTKFYKSNMLRLQSCGK